MLVIKNADILTMAAAGRIQGDILVENGTIRQVGPNITPPPGAKVLDAQGLIATPGLIDAHTHMGCFAGGGQNANEASAPANAELDVLHSVAPGPEFKAALREGITCMAILPGASTILGGTGCIVKSYGESTEEMLLVRKACMKASFSFSVGRAFGGAGGPATLMGHAALLREWLGRARTYAQNKALGRLAPGREDPALENLVPVIERRMPLRVHCESHNILNTIRIAEEFDILFTLEHAFGASAFIEEIAAAKGLRGVVFGPLYYAQMPGITKEVKGLAALPLYGRGVPVAIMSDYFPDINCGTLLYQAGELVRAGCDAETALRMLTIEPAKILGIEAHVGSIEPGKDADIVLFSAMPALDTAAWPVHIIAGGNIVATGGS